MVFTEKDRLYLLDAAKLAALAQVKHYSNIRNLLWMASSQLMGRGAPNTKRNRDIHSKIGAVLEMVPDEGDQFMRDVLGFEPENYDYFGMGRYDTAIAESGVPCGCGHKLDSHSDDECQECKACDEFIGVYEDPFETIKRLEALTPVP